MITEQDIEKLINNRYYKKLKEMVQNKEIDLREYIPRSSYSEKFVEDEDRVEIVEFLLQKGVNPNRSSGSLINNAVGNGFFKIVKLLLIYGCDPNELYDYMTPLELCVYKVGTIENIDKILELLIPVSNKFTKRTTLQILISCCKDTPCTTANGEFIISGSIYDNKCFQKLLEKHYLSDTDIFTDLIIKCTEFNDRRYSILSKKLKTIGKKNDKNIIYHIFNKQTNLIEELEYRVEKLEIENNFNK